MEYACKYKLHLGGGLSIELTAIITYAGLTATEVNKLKSMPKDIGLADVKTDTEHCAWTIKFAEDSVASIQRLLSTKSMHLGDVPFLFGNGTIRYKNLLILMDDSQRMPIPKALIKLAMIGFAYIYQFKQTDAALVQEQLKLIMETVTSSLQPNGLWNMCTLLEKADLISQKASSLDIMIEKTVTEL